MESGSQEEIEIEMKDNIKFVEGDLKCPICHNAYLFEVWRDNAPIYYHCKNDKCESRFEASHRIEASPSGGVQLTELARLLSPGSQEFALATIPMPDP
jgi:hypothetical protein